MFQKLLCTLIYVHYGYYVYLKNIALLNRVQYAYLSVYSECSIKHYQLTETVGVQYAAAGTVLADNVSSIPA